MSEKEKPDAETQKAVAEGLPVPAPAEGGKVKRPMSAEQKEKIRRGVLAARKKAGKLAGKGTPKPKGNGKEKRAAPKPKPTVANGVTALLMQRLGHLRAVAAIDAKVAKIRSVLAK